MKSYNVTDEFSALKEFTLSLPDTFDRIGLVIENKRNVVKKVITDQGTFVIKSFKGMYFFNRLAYSFFRKSKAVRSYLYARILNDKGIITPPPVAWINCYHFGLLTQSYFVSVYYPYKTLNQVLDDKGVNQSVKSSLFYHLAAFAIKLHNLGVYHHDFSLGNILVIETPDGYEFALVDLNRIRFHKVSYRKGLQNFAKLRMSPEDINLLITEYARQSSQLPAPSLDIFWTYSHRSSFLRKLRRRIRHYTVERILKVKHA